MANANLTPPILPYQDEDGNMPVSVTTEGVTMNPTPNWVRSIQDTENAYKTLRILANAYFEYEPVKNLILKTSISTDLGYEDRHYFQPSTAGRAFNSEPSALNANLRKKIMIIILIFRKRQLTIQKILVTIILMPYLDLLFKSIMLNMELCLGIILLMTVFRQ